MALGRRQLAGLASLALLALVLGAEMAAPAAAKDRARGRLKPLPVQAAPPGGPVTTVSTTVDVAPGVFALAKATCPDGSALVGGGYATDDPGLAPTGVTAVQYSRRDGLSSWKAGALRAGATPGTLTVEAYCRTGVPPLTEVSKTVFPPQYSSGGTDPISPVPIFVSCPPGQQAVAGGINSQSFAGSGPFLASGRAAGGGAWEIQTFPLPPSSTQASVTAYAYCAGAPVYEIKNTTASSGDPAIFIEPLAATATGCPAVTSQSKVKRKKRKRGKRKKPKVVTTTVQTQLVSGGFRTSPPIGLGVFAIDSSLYSSLGTIRTPEGGWRAFGLHQGTTQGTVTSEGYCMV